MSNVQPNTPTQGDGVAAPVLDITPRVWGWKCPVSGDCDEDYEAASYRAWFWLYKNNQILRHRIGLHQKQRRYSIAPRCDWCGKRTIR